MKKSILFIISLLMIMSGCNDDIDTGRLYFIGDSLVARWDLQESFPSWITVNDGLSGAGIDYIESLAGKYTGQDGVVLIGTNDMHRVKDGDINDYVTRYINAIKALDLDHIYLISLLPRNFSTDSKGINSTIVEFNTLVKSAVINDPSITYVDVYDYFCRDNTLNMEYSLDGLHLNVYGYEVLAKCVLDDLR